MNRDRRGERRRHLLNVELGPLLSGRALRIALVLVGGGDARAIAIARLLVGSAVISARRRDLVVGFAVGDRRARLFVDLVRLLGDIARGINAQYFLTGRLECLQEGTVIRPHFDNQVANLQVEKVDN